MGFISNSNPYYGGNAFADAINGGIEGWNKQTVMGMMRQDQIHKDSIYQAQIADYQQKQAAADQAAKLQSQNIQRLSPVNNQLFVAPGDQGPSNELSPYGQQQMGNIPQTLPPVPRQGLDADMQSQGLMAPPDAAPNPAYTQRMQALQSINGGNVQIPAPSVTSMEQLRMEAADPTLVPAFKEYRESQPKPFGDRDIMEAIKTGKVDPASFAAARQPDGSMDWSKVQVLDDKPKDPKAVSKPYVSSIGGKAIMLQDYSDGTTKMVAQDASTTNKISINQGSTNEVESAAQAIIAGNKAPASLGQRSGFRASVEARIQQLQPGFNLIDADAKAKLSQNVTLQQKAATAEILPDLIAQTAKIGKELDYSDLGPVGKAKMMYDSATNNPKYIEYVTKRNDLILTIGGVMRANGMTDMAQKLEEDSAPRSMSPRAFDAWAKGQLDSLKPRIENYRSQVGGKGTPKRGGHDPLGIL